MSDKYIPINKGNYSMDTEDRERAFDQKRGAGWDDEYAKYRENWSNYPKKQIVSDYPLLVDIELSSLCNLKCPMCYTITEEFKKKVNTTRMEWKLYKKIIDEVAGKVVAIRLSLRGEPSLHKNFIEAVSYAKNSGIKEVSVLTHGGKLNPIYFEKLVKAGIDWITISIDGLDHVYERVRKPLKFNSLLENIRKINEYKTRNNLKKPVIKIQGVWPAITESGVEKYYNTFSPYVDLVAFNPLIDYLSKDTQIEYLENFACPQQYQRLVIGADGLVMKCSNDEENTEILGDINQNTVHEIWHGDKMKQIRKLQMEPRGFMESSVCRKCYLPRKTLEEEGMVGERTFKVKNYVHRIQLIGG
jgi:radical SAM protein with 4Fe4S-binding SPASM domain